MSSNNTSQPEAAQDRGGRRTAGSVIVGLDGSAESDAALEWALGFADREAVIPVAVYSVMLTAGALSPGAPLIDPKVFAEAAEERMDRQLADHADLRDRAEVLEGHAGVTLVRRAASAQLLVVGTRGRSGLASAVLGSTSSYCAKHSKVPTVVVPEEAEVASPARSIVVGVDGSTNGDAALAWAMRSAGSATVHAVSALSHWNLVTTEYVPPPEVIDRELTQVVDDAVARVASAVDGVARATNVEPTVVQTDARAALREVVERVTADLLVVGARGTGGLPYLILGSVASAAVNHPVVPTVVVPRQPDQ